MSEIHIKCTAGEIDAETFLEIVHKAEEIQQLVGSKFKVLVTHFVVKNGENNTEFNKWLSTNVVATVDIKNVKLNI